MTRIFQRSIAILTVAKYVLDPSGMEVLEVEMVPFESKSYRTDELIIN